jgi:non-canonical (house-cleaning) NTP pyrophosphatase
MSAIQPSAGASHSLAIVTSVVVGSTNPVKIAAVMAVLGRSGSEARVRGIAVPSGVRDQPEGDPETIRGATQRARAALEVSDADLGVGIEGGVVEE